MSKNIFSVLQTNNDSDDEQQTNANDKGKSDHKPTKKELRTEDVTKREHFGDKVVKDENAHQKIKDGPKNKGDYKSGEARPFERHSGTGKPAFTHEFKKGGFGKGNVGTENDIKDELKRDDKNEEDKSNTEKQNVTVPEPKEEFITLDEYVAKSGFNTEFLKKEDEVKVGVVTVTDANLKVVAPHEKSTGVYNKKNLKHTDDFVHSNVNKLISGVPAQGTKPKQNDSKKTQKMEFNETNFPSLS